MNRYKTILPETEAMIYACAVEHPSWSSIHIHHVLLEKGVAVSYPTVLKLLEKNSLKTPSLRFGQQPRFDDGID